MFVLKKTKKRMSIEQFLEELRKTPRKWSYRGNRLVFDGDDICPISAVGAMLTEGQINSGNGSEAFDYSYAKKLGLSITNARKIIQAADNGRSSALREKLLEACGISDCYNEDYEEEFCDLYGRLPGEMLYEN